MADYPCLPPFGPPLRGVEKCACIFYGVLNLHLSICIFPSGEPF
ncbi:hypothetical protein PEC331060_18270 [Pectobacterium carotovorum subsp. carotovorum]|nr:hypothetical protein PEC331060_18270 [Pectobacterium carotovorum subsp. carotovorum]